MKSIIRLIPVVVICSFLVLSVLSCGGGGGGDSAPPATTSSTTVSGSVKLSGIASSKPGVSGRSALSDPVCAMALQGADVYLYDADRPEWIFPVARATSGLDCSYKINKLSYANLNRGPDGQAAYNDNNPIPSGNYTVLAKNDISIAGGKQYVAVQAYVKMFVGDVTGNDLVAYDSDTVPKVETMLGLDANADGTFAGPSTLLKQNAAIQITFNMAMARVSVLNAMNIKDDGNVKVPGNWKVSADLLSATFYPIANLTEAKPYYITVDAAAQNVYGIQLSKTFTGSFMTDVPDSTPPNAIRYAPLAQLDVPINTPIQIAANEMLDLNTIEVTSTPSIGDKPSVKYVKFIQDLMPGFDAYIYEITPNTLLSLNTDYAITVSGANDMAGNPLTTLEFNFKTETSATPPGVSSTVPGDGDTGVPIDTVVEAVFDSLIDQATITNATFVLNNGITNVVGSVAYDAGTKTVTLTPTLDLEAGTVHTATILSSVSDISGTPMIANATWLFTTSGSVTDLTDPTVPQNLTVTASTSSQADLSWIASSDNVAVTGYNIYNGLGLLIGTSSTTTFSETGLTNSTEYCYTVSAYDEATNESAESTQKCVTTPEPGGGTFRLPDTGQTSSFTAAFGEDHDYVIYPMSFTNNLDGTVTDDNTGLMWQQEDNNNLYNATDAVSYCDGLALAGYSDWRLPTRKEMMSISKYASNHAIDLAYFPTANAFSYWTSTVFAEDSTKAWSEEMTQGLFYSISKADSFYTRCVRGSDLPLPSYNDNGDGTVSESNTGLMWQKDDDTFFRTWEEAITYCEGLPLAGYGDWRLPNIKELDSIIDDTTYNPSADTAYFPNTSLLGYWSSTTLHSGYGYAMMGTFNFGNAGLYDKIAVLYTRCVRGGYGPDTWRPTSTDSAPLGRHDHTAVWTGDKMIVWGGYSGAGMSNTGGLYDPVADSWIVTNATGAPAKRWRHTATWTGNKMIIWGGSETTSASPVNTGGIYDPVTDTWTVINTTGAPSARYMHTAVWTGSKLLVWGGFEGSVAFNDGGVYDPATDTWDAITTTDSPEARYAHTAVWTGTKMLVWGGYSPTGIQNKNDGGIYDPTTDTWTVITTTGAPSARYMHTAVWTGTKMLVWGGYGDGYLNTGGIYDLAGDSWSSITTTDTPAGRTYFTSVWTGTKMIVWGGKETSITFNTGAAYNFATDSWSDISTAGAPGARERHTLVWTGTNMIVWGGQYGTNLDTGGIYKP